MTMPTPTDAQRAICAHCGHRIVWYFDIDPETEGATPYGFWYDEEHGTEACGGPDGDPIDDIYHEPKED